MIKKWKAGVLLEFPTSLSIINALKKSSKSFTEY